MIPYWAAGTNQKMFWTENGYMKLAFTFPQCTMGSQWTVCGLHSEQIQGQVLLRTCLCICFSDNCSLLK